MHFYGVLQVPTDYAHPEIAWEVVIEALSIPINV
jgi:hypothetical protein